MQIYGYFNFYLPKHIPILYASNVRANKWNYPDWASQSKDFRVNMLSQPFTIKTITVYHIRIQCFSVIFLLFSFHSYHIQLQITSEKIWLLVFHKQHSRNQLQISPPISIRKSLDILWHRWKLLKGQIEITTSKRGEVFGCVFSSNMLSRNSECHLLCTLLILQSIQLPISKSQIKKK